jgi:hypothetical protein
MTPKIMGSRTLTMALMPTADVAPLTAASSTVTARVTPGCAGTSPTSKRASSLVQGCGWVRSAGSSRRTGPSGSSSCAMARRWNGTPNFATRFSLARCWCGITARPRTLCEGSCSAGPMIQGTPLLSMEARGLSVHGSRSGLGRLGHLWLIWTLSSASPGSASDVDEGDGERSCCPRMIRLPSGRGGGKDKGRQDDQDDECADEECSNAEQRSAASG